MPSINRVKNRKLFKSAILIGIILVAGVRFYFDHVPVGVEFQPWILARVEGPILKSPDGKRMLRVFFNGAGAMHSGNHWTWIIEDCWWCGWRVVDEGYLSRDVETLRQPVPITWIPNNEFHVDFLSGRYDGR